jgi:hypothetical protein
MDNKHPNVGEAIIYFGVGNALKQGLHLVLAVDVATDTPIVSTGDGIHAFTQVTGHWCYVSRVKAIIPMLKKYE